MRDESWSPDVVVGYAQLHRLFKREEMVCAKTLYSYIDRNLLKIRNIDLPLKTRRKPKRSRPPAKRTRGGASMKDRRPLKTELNSGTGRSTRYKAKNQATWLC